MVSLFRRRLVRVIVFSSKDGMGIKKKERDRSNRLKYHGSL
jgi:hypothetical protein